MDSSANEKNDSKMTTQPSYIVYDSPFLQSFKDSLCNGLPALPPLTHLCLSRAATSTYGALSPSELAEYYKNSVLFQGSSAVCGNSGLLADRLNTVYALMGPVSTVSIALKAGEGTRANPTVTGFSVDFQVEQAEGIALCEITFNIAKSQDPKYILSSSPKCGSKFATAPSSAITPEASCFGALKFDGNAVTFPWCTNGNSYTDTNLASRYGSSSDTMALYSLGTNKLIVQFANNWSASSDSETLCTLEYHSIGLGETKGTFAVSEEDTVRGDASYLSVTSLDDPCISTITDDSSSGNFFLPSGDVASCGGNSFNDRFLFLSKKQYFVAASYIDLDTIIVVISNAEIITSNVGAQVYPTKRRDGITLGENDWMLVYKRVIPPVATTATIAASTVVIFSSASSGTSLPTTEPSTIIVSATVSDATSYESQSTNLVSTASLTITSASLLSATVSSAEVTQGSSTATVSLPASQTQTAALISTLSTTSVSFSASHTTAESQSAISISSTATVSANIACKTNTASQALTNIANGPIPASSSQNYSTDATDALAALIKQAPAVLAKTGTFQVASAFLLTGPLSATANVNLLGASFTGGVNGVGVLISSVEFKFLGNWDIQTYGDVTCTFVVNATSIDNGVAFYYVIDSTKVKSEWFGIQLSQDGKQLIVSVNTEHTVMASVSFGVTASKTRESIKDGFLVLNVVGSSIAPVSTTSALASSVTKVSTVSTTSILVSTSVQGTVLSTTSSSLVSVGATLSAFASTTSKTVTTASTTSATVQNASPSTFDSTTAKTTVTSTTPATAQIAAATTTSKTVQINVVVSSAKALVVSFLAVGLVFALL
ncbi:hypothetical protein BCR33DRAFT_767943 [Rhizoclosmatium globosum]|uniref:Uncharacterized protein n=1 Tax=Rhizoclosmatium globosum TaxID=329046 RepID=A0A1Y2C1A8_9FUNG|nr:hypothetical protein BCR33DRAFT_767943 [Rhizoclosmatium globosum]|eukprot:ORY40801.1 hypothetical protein BCR33DRAFT_767943 [Rhizoclosmatium globosum]